MHLQGEGRMRFKCLIADLVVDNWGLMGVRGTSLLSPVFRQRAVDTSARGASGSSQPLCGGSQRQLNDRSSRGG